MNSFANISQFKCPVKLPKLCAAIIYDLIVIIAILVFTTTLLFFCCFILHIITPEPHNILFRVYICGIVFAYYHVCWHYMRYGQTIGMKAWDIKLSNNKNRPISLLQSLQRIIGGILGFLTFGFGYLYIYFNKNNNSLADLLSDTKLYSN